MKIISFIILTYSLFNAAFGQNVGIGTVTPHNSAKLEVASATQGFLPPRMTYAQREAIIDPARGLVIWCTDCNEMQVFNGYLWKNMSGHAASGISVPTVKICNEVWMLKNLAVRTYRNGDSIPVVTDPAVWSNLTTGAMCWYSNNYGYDSIFGPLYNWYAVNDSRGLAPEGWHVASNEEWLATADCVGGDSIAAVKLRDTTSSLWNFNLPPFIAVYADNSSGFTGLPGGQRWVDGVFESLSTDGGFWWTSTGISINKAHAKVLPFDGAMMLNYEIFKTYGYSVRCIKD
jgi:uncharacterized protein (TIGR02145 family)